MLVGPLDIDEPTSDTGMHKYNIQAFLCLPLSTIHLMWLSFYWPCYHDYIIF